MTRLSDLGGWGLTFVFFEAHTPFFTLTRPDVRKSDGLKLRTFHLRPLSYLVCGNPFREEWQTSNRFNNICLCLVCTGNRGSAVPPPEINGKKTRMHRVKWASEASAVFLNTKFRKQEYISKGTTWSVSIGRWSSYFVSLSQPIRTVQLGIRFDIGLSIGLQYRCAEISWKTGRDRVM